VDRRQFIKTSVPAVAASLGLAGCFGDDVTLAPAMAKLNFITSDPADGSRDD
jgi:hypothetical protein